VAFLSLHRAGVVDLVPRLFVLSPADCSGKRAQLLRRAEADFPLARALQRGAAPLGEVFSFLSGLYFRGKLAYATRFGTAGPLIITPADGLQSPQLRVGAADLARWAATPIDLGNAAYRQSLTADAERLAASRPRAATVVLLGSLATPKYLGILAPIFGPALLVPREMLGRGDMSRGALLLRVARAGLELDYLPASAVPQRGRMRRVA
jgi:hypothetical protein